MFLNALIENIGRYEAAQGEIKLPPRPESLIYGIVQLHQKIARSRA